MFYYEQFFATALSGIDRSNIMPITIQIAQVILLISVLVAVYESFIRGGDVRMLGIAAVKYVAVGLILLGYATAFRDVNAMFNAQPSLLRRNQTPARRLHRDRGNEVLDLPLGILLSALQRVRMVWSKGSRILGCAVTLRSFREHLSEIPTSQEFGFSMT
jgi:hypothetical protein